MSERNINGSAAIDYGWATVKKDFWYFVGLAVLYCLVSSIGNSQHDHKTEWNLIGFFITAWLTGGYLKTVLSYHAGQKLSFSTLFTQVQYFWRILGAHLLLGVIIAAGFICFIIPGVYLALRFQFVVTLIVDQNLSIGAAFAASTRLTKGVKMSLLGFNLLCVGVMILGAICLGVGVLVALPVVWLAEVVVYRHLSTTPTAPTPTV